MTRLARIAAAVAVAAAASAPASGATRLSLADAVRIASGATPAVEIAGLETKAAESRRAEARGALLPSLSGTASAANRTFNKATIGIEFPSIPGVPPSSDLVGPFDVLDARFQVRQSLIDPAAWAKLRAAGDAVAVSRAERETSAEVAAQGASLAYLRALRAQAVVEARQLDSGIAARLLDLAEAQQKAGVSPAIDVTRARTQLAAARGQLLVAQNQLDRSRIDLARSLGLDPATGFDLADTLSDSIGGSAAPADTGAALAMALAHRPELLTQSSRLRRARSDRSAVAAERLPRLEASADYGLSGETGPDAIATRQVGVALTLPILDGLRREARIAEGNAAIREAEVRERDLRDQVAAETQAALLEIASGVDQQSVAEERVSLADQELAQATDRFKNGVAGHIELIDAQSTMVRARDARIDARYATAAARIALARAVGAARTVK
ncbi:MAG TPA: TolC family protein [Candidatus Eisenbacteria bacterium]|jgi:outer membrane protein TolC